MRAQAGFSLMAIGMPTTLLFDRAGREIGRLVGPAEWHSNDAKNLIRAAIAAVVQEGRVRTHDMLRLEGGTAALGRGAATTTQMTEAILAAL